MIDLQYILRKRAEGCTWDIIAALADNDGEICGMTGDRLRKRVARMLDTGVTTIAAAPTVLPATEFVIPGRPRLLLIPDTQAASDVPLDHFKWAGRYAAAKQFDAVVHIGDWGDFRAYSSYHTPLSKEGVRLKNDTDAVEESLRLFDEGLGGYKPTHQILTLGNHEDRHARYISDHPELQGSLTLPPFEAHGWKVFPFLQPVCVNGVYFAHYFTRTAKGWAGKNPHPNAQTMTRREMVSCVAGHTPGLDTYLHPAGGTKNLIRGLIAGSFYQHDEHWMGPQGNTYWRGLLVLNELHDGFYSLLEVTMDYLKRKYA